MLSLFAPILCLISHFVSIHCVKAKSIHVKINHNISSK